MVDILQAEGVSRYYHVAWADDSNGLNFSLTEYDGALMIGTYNDDSATESTDPDDYTWQIIGVAESGDGDPATAAAENEINALTAAVDDLTAKTITNAGNIDRANASSVEGIGQPNLLSGTNRGADGWTGSGFTLAAETGTVYNETDTPITWLKATCVTPGALSFTADGFRAILTEDSDTDTYTLSFDMRQSVLFDVNISMSDADGTNTQIDFGTADNESDILEDLRDMAGTWSHQALTAQIVDGNTESAQVLLFDCSAMTAGETVEIANLKIEGGAIATPWKASAEEAMNAANEALTIAGNTNQYFWHTETGTDTGAHITEIPKDDFISQTQIDPTSGGGNLLARSNGIAVRDGLTELATFGASGIQIGQSGGMHFEQTNSFMQFFDSNGIGRSKITADSTNGICIEDVTHQQYIKSTSSGIELVDDQNNGLKVDSGGIYINSVKVEDFVIDEGTSGNWRYRKWNSGKIEAWFNNSITMSATTAQGNLYRRSATLAIPSGIFTITPGVIAGSQQSDNTIVSVKASASSPTSIAITDYRTNQNSSTQARAVRIYAWQN